MPSKFRVYTSQEYDEATRRIAEFININTVQSINDLDKRISQNLLDDIKRKKGTIYKTLKDYWKDYVKPEEPTRKVPIKKINPQTQRRKFAKVRRIINRTNGIEYLKSVQRIKERNGKQYIVHKGRVYSAKNIIVYRHPRKSQVYITRRKPKRRK